MRATIRLGTFRDVGQDGVAKEVEVGFVDHEDGVRRGVGDGEEVFAADNGAGGVIGAGYDDELGFRGDGLEEALEGEGEGVVGLDPDEVVRHEADRDVVHEEGGGADEGFVAFVEEGAGDEVDGLVDAVGEDDLVRFEA